AETERGPPRRGRGEHHLGVTTAQRGPAGTRAPLRHLDGHQDAVLPAGAGLPGALGRLVLPGRGGLPPVRRGGDRQRRRRARPGHRQPRVRPRPQGAGQRPRRLRPGPV
ncbi:MAG: hypothetical protein AVDCRST_MAG24-406, partial [uncultured Nocardioidaceae bacterium]